MNGKQQSQITVNYSGCLDRPRENMNINSGQPVSGPKSTLLQYEEKRNYCFKLTVIMCYLHVTAIHTVFQQVIHTPAMLVSIISCEWSHVYSSEISADA
jgi:hypothetical protein